MPMYLTRFSYTPETWAKLNENPEDRRATATEYTEAVGGKLLGFWYAFGDHDAYNLWEAPRGQCSNRQGYAALHAASVRQHLNAVT